MNRKIIVEGKSAPIVAIVTDAEASRPIVFAAKELQKYLQQICGAALPIVDRADNPAFILQQTGDDADRDEYAVRVNGENVRIVGSNARSVLFGVYAFLENVCGVRFFSPEFEVVPTCECVTIPKEFSLTQSASFAIRSCRQEWNMSAGMIDWLAKNRFNGYSMDYWHLDAAATNAELAATVDAVDERGLMLVGSGHAMFHFLSAEKYFVDHPEWFAEVNGQRVPTKNTGDNFCYSNVQAVEAFAENLAAMCRRFPSMRRICIWAGDGGAVCRCGACSQHAFPQLFARTVLAIGDRLRREFPDMIVSQLAYNCDPSDKTCALFDVPQTTPTLPTMFAFWGQNLSQPFAANSQFTHQHAYRHIEKFCQRSPGQAAIFAYHTDTYMNSDVCPVFASAMATDTKEFHQLGIDETCLLWIPWQRPETTVDLKWIAWQNGALWGRLAMDIAFDVAAFRDEFVRCAFGINQATRAGMLLASLNEIISRLGPMILTFVGPPPRPMDAWACAFSAEVLKWTPQSEQNDIRDRRRELFAQMENDLIALRRQTDALDDTDRPQCTAFKDYVAHCCRRITGLRQIFIAQNAIADECWADAAASLQWAIDTGMPEELEQTQQWLDLCRQKL